LVRNASTSNLKSLLTKVTASTSPRGTSFKTSAFRSVSRCGARAAAAVEVFEPLLPAAARSSRWSCGRSLRFVKVYATVPWWATEKSPTRPSAAMSATGGPARGSWYKRTYPRSWTVQ
jgi:hypothetical protein